MKSEQHIPDCDSWLVRPPAWLCSVSTRNIWKFCLSVLRFPSFISDWLICFPHSESTNIEQQEITINGCLGPSAVHCSIWMHMRATLLTNTEFLHINTLCSHTYTLSHRTLCFLQKLSVSSHHLLMVSVVSVVIWPLSWKSFTGQKNFKTSNKIFRLEKETMEISKEKSSAMLENVL